MKKLIYTNSKGSISIVVPVPKDQLERVLGPLTDTQYKNHVVQRSITDQGIVDFREIEDLDIPTSREFRDAWVDVTSDSKIDICCTKAKEIALSHLRTKRDVLLEAKDKEAIIALGKGLDVSDIEAEKQLLRDCTEVLKNIDTVDKVNDEVVLDLIRQERDKL